MNPAASLPPSAALPEAFRKAAAPDGVIRAERAFIVNRKTVDVEARTVELAFASELPYERYWGIEILDCTAPAIRMGRLNSGANLLLEHCPDDVVGVVESVTVGKDRVARAVVRFGKSEDAEEVFQDVIDGIRRNVSVGYLIHKAVLVETVDDVETYRVTDWEPFEVSLVAIPADPNVGVGRSLLASAHAAPAPIAALESSTESTESTLSKKSQEPITMLPDAAAPIAAPAIEVVAKRNHAQEIATLAAGMPANVQPLAMKSIQAGSTVEQFQAEAIRALSSAPIPTADIGLSDKEVKQYSLMRMINALASRDPNDINAAAFEFECSRAVTKIAGKNPQGVFVPYDVLAGKRDLTVGNATSAGNLKATNLLASSFIDLLRNRLVIGDLGITYLSGLVGNIEIPRQTGAGTAYWLAEQGLPTKGDQTTDKVAMSPKIVGAKTVVSRLLRQQASIDVEAMIQRDLSEVMARAIQQAIISGSGASNQPTGILTNGSVATVAMGTNGAVPDWASIIKMETLVSAANADNGNLAYLTNAKVRGQLKNTAKLGNTLALPVWDSSSEPLNGYKGLVTNAVPSNLTKGTSTGVCSAIVFGDWSSLIVGLWGGLDVLVDPYTGGDSGDISIRMLQDIDIGVRHPESFAKMVDALTP